MELDSDGVCVLIPTMNEAPTIGDLVRSFRDRGFPHILIIDGHSTDGTDQIARREGATVYPQTSRGKENAIIEVLPTIRSPYILMLDGDGTYAPEDADRMLAPLVQGYDHVIGERIDRAGSYSHLNRLGNYVINYLFKVAHGKYLSDILSGYRAFTLSSISRLQLKEEGFEIETEMAVQAMMNNQRIAVVPVEYRSRAGTKTKLKPFRDGFRIIRTIYRLAKQNNPLFYFGLMGVLVTLLGGITGLYVVYEWLLGIEHIPLTLLTLLLTTLGFEIIIFGVLADLILAFHREILFELRELREPKPPR